MYTYIYIYIYKEATLDTLTFSCDCVVSCPLGHNLRPLSPVIVSDDCSKRTSYPIMTDMRVELTSSACPFDLCL